MFRQMRRHAQQLDDAACETILHEARRGVLAVIGDDGYPYTIPLNYVYDDGRVFFHSAREGHKLDAIAACDKCSFCVTDEGTLEPGEWWYHVRSVVAFGRIRLLEDDDEVRAALLKLGRKYFPAGYDTEGDIARSMPRVAVLELRIEHMSGKHVREK